MDVTPPVSRSARLATAALAVLGLLGGWYIVLSGGFEHGKKYTRETLHRIGILHIILPSRGLPLADLEWRAAAQAHP
jgi:hypothetical protein